MKPDCPSLAQKPRAMAGAGKSGWQKRSGGLTRRTFSHTPFLSLDGQPVHPHRQTLRGWQGDRIIELQRVWPTKYTLVQNEATGSYSFPGSVCLAVAEAEPRIEAEAVAEAAAEAEAEVENESAREAAAANSKIVTTLRQNTPSLTPSRRPSSRPFASPATTSRTRDPLLSCLQS